MQQNCICCKTSLFLYLSFAEIYNIKSQVQAVERLIVYARAVFVYANMFALYRMHGTYEAFACKSTLLFSLRYNLIRYYW